MHPLFPIPKRPWWEKVLVSAITFIGRALIVAALIFYFLLVLAEIGFFGPG